MKKYIKIFFLELILVLIVFACFFYNKKNQNLIINYNASVPYNKTEYEDDVNSKKLYNKLEKALLDGDTKINMDLSSLFIEASKIFSTLEMISYRNPEVMYYKGAEYSFGNIKISYSKPTEDIKRHQTEVKDKKDEFIQGNIKKTMSDYEKVISIHDYIVENGQYDTRLFTKGEVPAESYSTYGILVLGVGVCESYAKAMKYLLDATGIESMIVIGSSRGENHAWNLVNIEGEYYHIDSTWNDPIMGDGSHLIRYNFFNLNDEQIEKTHNWDKTDYPEAKGTKYNYYKYNNLIVNGEEEFKYKLKNELLKRVPEYSLKILNLNEDLDLNKIIEEIGYTNYEQIMLKGYNYYIDNEQQIVSFQFYYH